MAENRLPYLDPPSVLDSPQPQIEQPGFSIDPYEKRRTGWKRFCKVMKIITNAIILIITVGIAAGLLVSAYSEEVSPEQFRWGTIVTMTLPIWIIAATVIFIIDLIWWRRTAVIIGVAMLCCVGQITAFCPLNIPCGSMSEKQEKNSFTLLTYNVYEFLDYQGLKPDYNQQLSYVIKANADVVCLQEASYLSPKANNHIKTEQIDSLDRLYPYTFMLGKHFAILSKFPVEAISLNFPEAQFKSGAIGGWRLRINDKIVNLFCVHLCSLGLTHHDKNLYNDVVKLENDPRQDVIGFRKEVMPKIASAGVERAKQIQYLNGYLQKYGGKNAIVCGDFNDPVGSYPLYSLEEKSHMKQAYAECGFGPMITYYANHLYFRIDHVLYRGEMKPYSMSRGHIKASDHYPVITKFILK